MNAVVDENKSGIHEQQFDATNADNFPQLSVNVVCLTIIMTN
jgi:hypothetical protein